MIKKFRRGTNILLAIVGEPDKQHPYYWVAVGEDNGMSFVTHFGFYVYTSGGKILYVDKFTGKAVDLKTWRRNHYQN